MHLRLPWPRPSAQMAVPQFPEPKTIPQSHVMQQARHLFIGIIALLRCICGCQDQCEGLVLVGTLFSRNDLVSRAGDNTAPTRDILDMDASAATLNSMPGTEWGIAISSSSTGLPSL